MHVSYRYLLIIVLVAALLCLMPARGADAPNEKKPQTAAAQSVESAEAPAGADLSAQTNRETYLHRTLYYAPCGHSVQRREKLPAQLVGLTRGALEKEIGGLYESAAVTGYSVRRMLRISRRQRMNWRLTPEKCGPSFSPCGVRMRSAWDTAKQPHGRIY